MAIQQIPMENVSRQTLTARLGDNEVGLTIWRQERGGWFATVELAGVPVASGRRINSNVAVAGPRQGLSGQIICMPTRAGYRGGLGEKPWGMTHRLVWIDANE